MLKSVRLKIIGLIILILLLTISFIGSIALGQRSIPLQTTFDAIFHFDKTITEHIIVTTSRLTRAIIATIIGANLAIAGALMQALTKNPLASPDILGVNAGALFFIVCSVTFFQVESLVHYMWVAFIGAGIAGGLVYFLGSLGRQGLTPLKIVLAGTAISALFVSFTQGLLVIDEQKLQSILFWLAGSVAGRSLDMLIPVLPFMVVATLLAFSLGNSINIFMFGDEVATGLGQQTIIIKILIGISIILLAGGSVAVAGSIGFVGLIVPHIVRGLVGQDYRWVLPLSALAGASLLLLADTTARFIIIPQEIPIGVMTAFVGTPFFIYLARRRLSGNE
nr:iron ABC transporter permease [Metabacillus malikii]